MFFYWLRVKYINVFRYLLLYICIGMIKTVILHVHEFKFITKCYVAHLQVLISNRRAQGIEFIHRGISFSVQTDREVILTAGTYGSPAILIRSGIGPAEQLQRLQVCSSILLVGQFMVYCMVGLLVGWLVCQLVFRLVGWSIGWFIVYCMVGWLVNSLVGSQFIAWLVIWLFAFLVWFSWLIGRLIDGILHGFFHWLVQVDT